MKPRAKDVVVCLLWWLTISIVFPYQALKRGLVRSRLAGFLLIIPSPAALLTFLVVWLAVLSFKDSRLEPDQAPFSGWVELAALTGRTDIPDFTRAKAYRDGWEGRTQIRYTYTADSMSEETLEDLERMCADRDNPFWTKSEASDTSFYGHSRYTFSRGWVTGIVDKPYETFPDDMHVTVSFGEKGFDVTYKPNGPSYSGVMALANADSLKRYTCVDFPAFEPVSYEWFNRVDPSAIVTIRFEKVPDRRFLRELEQSPAWKEGDGFFSFETPIGENTREAYSVKIERGSRLATIRYDTF